MSVADGSSPVAEACRDTNAYSVTIRAESQSGRPCLIATARARAVVTTGALATARRAFL